MITVKGYAATAIEQLPRQFKRPHKLDKKTGTRKLTYSSRIEKKNDAEREEFFTVKEMLCPEKVRLSKDVDGKTNRHQERTLHALQSGRLSNRKTKEKRHWCPTVEKVNRCNSFYKCYLQGYYGVIDLKSNLLIASNDKYIFKRN